MKREEILKRFIPAEGYFLVQREQSFERMVPQAEHYYHQAAHLLGTVLKVMKINNKEMLWKQEPCSKVFFDRCRSCKMFQDERGIEYWLVHKDEIVGTWKTDEVFIIEENEKVVYKEF